MEKDARNALFAHCKKTSDRRQKSDWQGQLADHFEVIFVERSRKELLDVAEGWWVAKLKSGINISRTIISKY